MAVVSRTASQKSWQIAEELGSLLRAVEDEKRSLGARLRDLARAHGLTSDEEAARHVGVSYRQYQRWLAGNSEPRGHSLSLIATAYGQDALSHLFGPPDKSQLDRIEERVDQLYAMLTEPAGAARGAAALGARSVEAAGSTRLTARERQARTRAERQRKSA